MLKAVMEKYEMDALLVSGEANMRYISGFSGGTGFLLLTEDGRYVLTDSRYTVQAEQEAAGYTVVDAAAGYAAAINACMKKKVKRLGFEGQRVLFSSYSMLKEKLDAEELVPIGSELDELRMVKTEEELECIRRAEAIGDMAFEQIVSYIKPGMTELEVAARLEYIMKTEGAEALSFDSIVASGLNSAMPHAKPGRKKIEKGDFVTMDFGCKYRGYCSDMTRTIVVGKASERQKEIYELVLKAQEEALAFIHAGVTGKEVDDVARKVITEAGYGDCFGHGLGHGVGLEIHELPNLSKSGLTVLKPGMIETVEPGIYIKGFGGVRIEDLVAVMENGCINFTNSPKYLIEL
ncbi:Xaa-Pro peptidase family protein [Anaerolentibacter hominis]|uniref:M24 family metallopeptidase n=1 Tax=Anaerolentibacter hominis TaxID=3079009 RepID=UPI0031B85DB7